MNICVILWDNFCFGGDREWEGELGVGGVVVVMEMICCVFA